MISVHVIVHGMSEETVHGAPVHDRKEYRKKWMQEKRAAERLKKQLVEDQSGEVSLASVEKESVVGTALGDSDGVTSDSVKVATVVAGTPLPLTETDAKFEALSPGYWIYGNEVKDRKCWQCGKPYETRLELNKFCSPGCKEKWLSDTFGKLKGC